ncbi:YibE/F family protein [Paucilactobacillus suebicus]|uniref:Multitransmembrane protein n=1 Tax=Paucilactobacillus suebicus DSM 5007 = KCTC 3549 TaxID=1423807 RepID=A0A0R1WBY5_9LACO|nr:YibE/F family protein [Paucilactobacillus suebicus]KRM13524.1 hypothetical protein FD16_GL000093 [Paucilactobacillus suebicus DSM 5007 = KCTC 3549]
MKKFVNQHTIVVALIVIITGVLAMTFVTHDQGLYQRTIAQVQTVKNGKPQRQKDNFDNVDHLVNQSIKAKIMNGRYKGQTVRLTNQYSDSHAMDQKFKIGDQVFVKLSGSKHNLGGTIQDYKRDRVLVFLVWLVVVLLLLIMRFNGALALLSVLLNGVIFFLSIQLDLKMQATYVMLIFGSLSFVFAVLTLLIVQGPSKKMLATLGATTLGTAVAMGLSLLVFSLTHERGMYYESMQYVTQVPRPLFLAETLLGSLGAVMDESTDIVSTLFELKQLNPDVTAKSLFLSGRRVGQSIMGPLINVLFMIFMADTFTMSLLYLKNGNSWGYTFAMNMGLGTVQSLISGIGIVLAIPVASALAGILLGKRGAKIS